MQAWVEQGLMNRVQRNKLVFIETTDHSEMNLALHNYRKASGCGFIVIVDHFSRLVRTVGELFYCLLQEGKFRKELILVKMLNLKF